MRFVNICLVVSLLVCFSLFSCQKSISAPDTVVLTNVYTASPVSAPEMDASVFHRVYCTSDGFSLFDTLSGTRIYRFDCDGTYLETISLLTERKDLSFVQVFLLQDGNYLGFALDSSTKTYSLLILSKDGYLLWETVLEDADFTAMFGICGTEILWIQNTTVTVFAGDLSVLRQFSLSFFPTELRVVENTVYLLANDSLYTFDTETGKCAECGTAKQINGASVYPGTAYAYYHMDTDGIWGIKETDKTLLCSFASSFLSVMDVENLYVLSTESFLIRYRDPVQKTSRLMLLRPSDAVVEKAPVRVAVVSSFASPDFHAFCNAFNQSGTPFFAEITDYSVNNTERRYTYAAERFQMDLLSGERYDLYYLSGYADSTLRQTLLANGSLADISTVYTENILPTIRDTYLEENGSAYSVPYQMCYVVLASKAGQDSSVETMQELLESGKPLSGEDIGSTMNRVFSDGLHSEKKCNFTTQTSLSFLDLLRLQADNVTGKYGITASALYPEGYTAFCISDRTYVTALQTGAVAYLRMSLTQPWMMAIAKDIYGTGNLLGFPTVDGGSAAYATSEGTISVPKTAQNTIGAVTFLRSTYPMKRKAALSYRKTVFP